MPFTDFRSTASWQAALALGPGLVRLAEELPASEQLGLAWQLQQTMVELPAAIAFDVQETGRDTRIPVALKLVAALDLVEHIYPALDTAAVRTSVDTLMDRLTSDNFVYTGQAAASSPEIKPLPAPAAPKSEPASVQITPEADDPAGPPGPPKVIIAPAPAAQPAPDQDTDVHPDSSQ